MNVGTEILGGGPVLDLPNMDGPYYNESNLHSTTLTFTIVPPGPFSIYQVTANKKNDINGGAGFQSTDVFRCM